MAATGRKQTTARFSSDPAAGDAENFRRFQACFLAGGDASGRFPAYAFDARSGPLAPGFRFQVRCTRTLTAALTRVRASANALGGTIGTFTAGQFVEVFLQMKGAATVVLPTRTVTLSRDTLLIKDPAQPCLFVNQGDGEHFALMLPEPYFRAHAGPPDKGFLGQAVALSSPAGRLLKNVMRLACESLETLDARDADSLCQGVLCFLRPVLLELHRAQRSAMPQHDALRSRALDLMRKAAPRAGTTVAGIARELGVSARHLTKVFREAGSAPAAALMDVRLERARVELLEPHRAAEPVAAIALGCGFRSGAHFSRAFKGKYGITPSVFRKEGKLI
ncbi:MAG: helix-turn-helix domain-containing protein [Duodenibacillus sp.]|nr:helix-turn-helix domain-containing protein [Duodenibacillus sp.]